jgi:hypothetical protein
MDCTHISETFKAVRDEAETSYTWRDVVLLALEDFLAVGAA